MLGSIAVILGGLVLKNYGLEMEICASYFLMGIFFLFGLNPPSNNVNF
jgi:hypothetical protein